MKLRQKLAVALASAMVVTSVPVVTMASSSNKIVRSTQVIKKDSISTDATLRIKFEDGDTAPSTTTVNEEFYFTLTNAEWLDTNNTEQLGCLNAMSSYGIVAAAAGDTAWTFNITTDKKASGVKVVYTREADDTVKVQVYGAEKDEQIKFPMPIKAKSGEISVAITTEGSGSTITEGKYSFASTGDKAGNVTIGDVESFYDNGELSKIVIKENYVGSLSAAAHGLVLKVELNDTDFEFLSSTATVKGTYGLAGFSTTTAKVEVDSEDKSTAYIYIDGYQTSNKSLGRLEITGLTVDNDEKDIEVGELKADIKSVKADSLDDDIQTAFGLTDASELVELDKEYKDQVVAKIVNYGAYIEMKDQKAVDIVAGRDKEVEFTVAEAIDDCFVGSREIEITLDSDEYDDSNFWVKFNGLNADYKADFITTDGDDNGIIESIKVVWNDEDAIKEDQKKVAADRQTHYKADKLVVKLKAEGNKTEDKSATPSKKLNSNKIKDEFTLKATVYVPVDQKDKKELTLVASMRGVDEFKSATAVNVINPFEVTFDQTTLKVGLQNQKAGKIVIKETDKEMFSKGDIIFDITAGKNANPAIVIEEEGKLTVEGDLKKADLKDTDSKKYADDKEVITLGRQSKAASTLTIEDMLVTVDRTVPEGSYDLELSGDAIDIHGGTLKIKDYIVIGTPNTQDITASNGLAKGTATFVIGESKYVLNGEEKVMDAQSYIQAPGYTMVPVRYIAQAFGVAEKDIMFGQGTVTMFAGNRTVQLTNGSAIAKVNGADVAMATKVVIKDGRTYAPVGEIARILGVSCNWDSATKTATFENK